MASTQSGGGGSSDLVDLAALRAASQRAAVAATAAAIASGVDIAPAGGTNDDIQQQQQGSSVAESAAALKRLARSQQQRPAMTNLAARRSLWRKLIASSVSESAPQCAIAEGSDWPSWCLPDYRQFYCLSPAGQAALNRICRRLTICRHDLFAPCLLPIGALLLHCLTEAETLACLHSLLGKEDRGLWRLPDSLLRYAKCERLLEQLVGRFAVKFSRSLPTFPNYADHLRRWFHYLWRMPLDFLLPLMDSFLVEGFKVLVRAGLVLCRLSFKKRIRQRSSSGGSAALAGLDDSLGALMGETAQGIGVYVTVDQFTRMMFQIRNLQSADIVAAANAVPNQRLLAELPPGLRAARNATDDWLLCLPLSCPSSLLTENQLRQLLRHVPSRHAIKPLAPLFSTATSGYNLQTLYSAAEKNAPLLLLVSASSGGGTFGAYLCTALSERAHHPAAFFGTGETFLFTTAGDKDGDVKVYTWVGQQQQQQQQEAMFIMAEPDNLVIGGGGGGFGLSLNRDLSEGFSQRCATFDSQPLLAGSELRFSVRCIELLGFDERSDAA